MGEIADFEIGAIVEYDGMSFPYEPEDDGDRWSQKTHRCKYCGEIDLMWRQFEHGWRLVDKYDEIHECEDYDG